MCKPRSKHRARIKIAEEMHNAHILALDDHATHATLVEQQQCCGKQHTCMQVNYAAALQQNGHLSLNKSISAATQGIEYKMISIMLDELKNWGKQSDCTNALLFHRANAATKSAADALKVRELVSPPWHTSAIERTLQHKWIIDSHLNNSWETLILTYLIAFIYFARPQQLTAVVNTAITWP